MLHRWGQVCFAQSYCYFIIRVSYDLARISCLGL
jgi:hypothetical protein